ncbi:hypothetical protein Ataiwa_34890 [Algoriphagus taiwanensis]|uniref:Uncharacterized protein n=1 Tax=Algoriphagus taiwanensis TaxID=1445656 RepID=A0ABQ6Q4V8_9BACT|nr:hypothetical protein Ataiwa_34890 [Algoriphagus taiwanensis]
MAPEVFFGAFLFLVVKHSCQLSLILNLANQNLAL